MKTNFNLGENKNITIKETSKLYSNNTLSLYKKIDLILSEIFKEDHQDL